LPGSGGIKSYEGEGPCSILTTNGF
jgi:hypothetical protein